MKKKKNSLVSHPFPYHTGEGISAAFEILKESVHVERWHRVRPRRLSGRRPCDWAVSAGAVGLLLSGQPAAAALCPAQGLGAGTPSVRPVHLRIMPHVPSCAAAAVPWEGSPGVHDHLHSGGRPGRHLGPQGGGEAKGLASAQVGFHHQQGGAGLLVVPSLSGASYMPPTTGPSLRASTRPTGAPAGTAPSAR